MRIKFYKILSILMLVFITVCVADKIIQCQKYDTCVISCVSDFAAEQLVQVTKTDMSGFKISETDGLEMEDIRMQIIYQLARRSVVKVVVKKSVGSGIIWKIEDGIVIAANKHLLMDDVVADITFCSGNTVKARIVGYSQQYDIGFVKVHEDYVTENILRDIFEAVPELYEVETQEDKDKFAGEFADKKVLQVGAVIEEGVANFSSGSINGLGFVPVFNTNVLETQCYSKAGMSGGGVFDSCGKFLGMISGGEVCEESKVKESEITYSIPAVIIEKEYNDIVGNRGKKYW